MQTAARGRDDLFLFCGLYLLLGGKTTADVIKTQKNKHCSSYDKIIEVKRLLSCFTIAGYSSGMKIILRKGIPPERVATVTQPLVVSSNEIFYLYDISCTYLRPTHNY